MNRTFNENNSKYSLERRFFWVQSQLCSSIRSEVIEILLRHVKTKNCPKKDSFKTFSFFTRFVNTRLWFKHLGPPPVVVEQDVPKYNFWDQAAVCSLKTCEIMLKWRQLVQEEVCKKLIVFAIQNFDPCLYFFQ